ncbi:hypothetical protein LF41_648 [Lysobacter dokdonensis DS-58]|uniref:Peptidyl-Asp metalloendopeptidase n=1 Tax=Lysobacter dokdonensis DS-58 TaxID=1300345 RepID=A0A0A2X078_9GAMM|nr:M12 family metallo-peptidase [Lysobacter dokdonensis]KGQ18619.1 hypothetical protein LF41_648 [Lysobacter dokdonensis DS-58]
MKQSRKIAWTVVTGVSLIAGIAWWQSGDAPLRIAPVQSAHAATPALKLQGAFDVVGEAHPIALDAAMARAAMRDGTLRVTLPDGTTYPVKMQRQETDAFGQWSVIGHVDTPVGPQAAVLTFGGNAVFGTLPMPNGRMLRIVTNHGRVQASLDGGLIPPGKALTSDIAPRPKEDLAAVRAQRLAARGLPMRNATAGAQKERVQVPASTPAPVDNTLVTAAASGLPPVTITVMAAYADDLVALRGSDAAVQTELSNLVAAANQAHIDSNSRVRFSLVRRQKLTVPTSMDNYDVLYQMTADLVGGIDLELLRDQYSADLVTFVRPSNAAYTDCGIAWVGGSGNRGTETENLFGFSVVNTEPCGAHVMAHELGHNLGSAHDRETDWVDGEYPHGSHPYAFGYRRLTAPKFATIMAYTDANEPWIGRFSDPNSSLCGARCGIPDLSDNVRAFDRMAHRLRIPHRAGQADGLRQRRLGTRLGRQRVHRDARAPQRLRDERRRAVRRADRRRHRDGHGRLRNRQPDVGRDPAWIPQRIVVPHPRAAGHGGRR